MTPSENRWGVVPGDLVEINHGPALWYKLPNPEDMSGDPPYLAHELWFDSEKTVLCARGAPVTGVFLEASNDINSKTYTYGTIFFVILHPEYGSMVGRADETLVKVTKLGG